MSDIVLATLNARYIHSAFGLRYLFANMGELQDRSSLLEFVINDHPAEILGKLLATSPTIIGFGVYIWNVEATHRIVADIKAVRPETIIILGGPEVSYETEGQPIVELADYVITGEADLAFPELCQRLLNNDRPAIKIISAPVPKVADLKLPYEFYSPNDIAHRILYVEVSRGCPFTCEFCLSSLDIPVRLFDLDAFLLAMQRLLDLGARQFKFVDRTFNLHLRVSRSILQFFLERFEPGMFLHFEMIPDRLPEALRELIVRFPPGSLQFEIGVQSFNDEVGELISRRQDNTKLEENFRFLHEFTGVHIHADLIVGLPGESLESFAAGFDRLYALQPQEIQVGILKRLRGTPITRHDETWQMIYSPHPPYEILSTRLMDFSTIQGLRRFARYWDLIGNSGNFIKTLPLLCPETGSAFEAFYSLGQWLYSKQPQLYGISLVRLFELVFEYLHAQSSLDGQYIAEQIWQDYNRNVRREKPGFLKGYQLEVNVPTGGTTELPSRQSRHLAS
jgi:radical SAM superfamily enzyme YgiQ (UPF0313 family)